MKKKRPEFMLATLIMTVWTPVMRHCKHAMLEIVLANLFAAAWIRKPETRDCITQEVMDVVPISQADVNRAPASKLSEVRPAKRCTAPASSSWRRDGHSALRSFMLPCHTAAAASASDTEVSTSPEHADSTSSSPACIPMHLLQ